MKAIASQYRRNLVIESFATLNANVWTRIPLLNPEFFILFMRTSLVVLNSRMTTVMNVKLTIRYDMGVATSALVFWNIFLVSPMNDSAKHMDANLFALLDYVQMKDYPGRNVDLNKGKCNVVRRKYDTLSLRPLTSIDSNVNNAQYADYPESTYGEFTWNVKMNIHVEQPGAGAWTKEENSLICRITTNISLWYIHGVRARRHCRRRGLGTMLFLRVRIKFEH